jgi:hypothetical protein
MTTAETQNSSGMGKDIDRLRFSAGPGRDPVRHRLSGHQRVANVRAHADRRDHRGGLALLFFMHLWENRGLMWFVLIFTVAVILGMQYGWTDSFRLVERRTMGEVAALTGECIGA